MMDKSFRSRMAVTKGYVRFLRVSKMTVRRIRALVHVIPFLEQRIVGGSWVLPGVDLRRIGHQCGASWILHPINTDPRQIEIIAIAISRCAPLQLELRQSVIKCR